MKFVVIYEKSADGYGAYLPDLPGCVALGDTLEETRGLMGEALADHLEFMRERG